MHYNEILVNLLPAEERERSLEEVKAAVREKLEEFPGVSMSIGQPISHRLDHLLSGVEAQVAVKIFGPRLSVLRDKAEEVRAVMAGGNGHPRAPLVCIERRSLVLLCDTFYKYLWLLCL